MTDTTTTTTPATETETKINLDSPIFATYGVDPHGTTETLAQTISDADAAVAAITQRSTTIITLAVAVLAQEHGYDSEALQKVTGRGRQTVANMLKSAKIITAFTRPVTESVASGIVSTVAQGKITEKDAETIITDMSGAPTKALGAMRKITEDKASKGAGSRGGSVSPSVVLRQAKTLTASLTTLTEKGNETFLGGDDTLDVLLSLESAVKDAIATALAHQEATEGDAETEAA